MNRMQFLRGKFGSETAFRPPWAVAENDFMDTCDRCDRCIKSCHLKVIKRGAGGFPEMDFTNTGCDFCQACVQNCPTDALHLTKANYHQPWNLKANFKDNCLSERGVVCRACGDICEMRAIQFKLAIGGITLIEMNTAECNGCGECISVCPVQAIEMKQVKNNDQLETVYE